MIGSGVIITYCTVLVKNRECDSAFLITRIIIVLNFEVIDRKTINMAVHHSALLVIFCALDDGEGAVENFEQERAHELMGKGEL